VTDNLWILFAAAGVMAVVIGGLALLGDHYTLNNIKSRTVGDGQHGTARWATEQEIRSNYALVPFQVADWRVGKNLPEAQGLVLGSRDSRKGGITALVDSDDIHCLMIGASGVGKTAYFLYPNLEYACACGMSFFATDTKGDLARNYGAVAEKYYGYHVSVVDLRNPTRSDGYNLMTLINRYMDKALREHSIEAYGKAENLINILAHSIISPKDEESRGQNEYFYKAAEGVVASVLLLLAEFLPPDKEHPTERRHLVSVFILIQQLLAPSGMRGQSYFKQLMDMLPAHHRARNLASSALESSDQATASAMSTALAQMNTFMDIALEQVICFDNNIDAEKFAKEKTALFLILPEEDRTKNFMAGLMIQNLSKELFELAEKGSGRLPNRVVFYCDEFGTMPAFDVEALFSAGRSRGITLVPIIQSLAQLDKNYGDKGAESIVDNCQDTIFGGFAPNSQTAEQLSKSLGSRTVLSGSVSRGKNDPSQSLQMIERPLMTPDELKSIPKGNFVVMKTGTHPMQTKLRLFLDWGITFDAVYATPEHAARSVAYASRAELLDSIDRTYPKTQPVLAPTPGKHEMRRQRSGQTYEEGTP
jgi:type IV secretion system protein VirD4